MTVIVIFVPNNRLHCIADVTSLLVPLFWSYVASKNRYSGWRVLVAWQMLGVKRNRDKI